MEESEEIDTFEIDNIVNCFKVSELRDIGSSLTWFDKCQKISKLYRVAVSESLFEQSSVERVKLSMINYSKLDDMIQELVTICAWKELVLPQLLKLQSKPKHSFQTYIVLYYEVQIHGILQAMMYHGDTFNYIIDTCDDLVEYCVFRLTHLMTPQHITTEEASGNPIEDIKLQNTVITFNVASQCIATLRYICENLDGLPLSVSSRIYSTHDLPVLVTQLLDQSVWTQKMGDRVLKFKESSWELVKIDDPPLTKMECQVWLLIRQVLLSTAAQNVYHYSNYRKEQLTKLLKYLNDRVLDQLSALIDLQRYLYMLQMQPPPEGNREIHNPLIVEVTPLFKDNLLKKYNGSFKKIAENCSEFLFNENSELVSILAQKFSDSFQFLAEIKEKVQSCGYCLKNAAKKCSRCKQVWYCSRSCQVQHWVIHQKICNKAKTQN